MEFLRPTQTDLDRYEADQWMSYSDMLSTSINIENLKSMFNTKVEECEKGQIVLGLYITSGSKTSEELHSFFDYLNFLNKISGLKEKGAHGEAILMCAFPDSDVSPA